MYFVDVLMVAATGVQKQQYLWGKIEDKYLFNFSVPYKEAAQGVAGVHLGAFQSHHDVSVLLAVLHWPVLVTLPLQEQIQLMRDCVWITTVRDVVTEPTLPFSTRLVIMMMIWVFCSQIILQKSSNVDLRGPWAAI